VGLRAQRRIQFFNSGIECRLLEYELYEGSRKKLYLLLVSVVILYSNLVRDPCMAGGIVSWAGKFTVS